MEVDRNGVFLKWCDEVCGWNGNNKVEQSGSTRAEMDEMQNICNVAECSLLIMKRWLAH